MGNTFLSLGTITTHLFWHFYIHFYYIDVEMGTRVKKNILKLERVYFTEYKAVNISIKHSTNEDNLTM